MKNIQPLEIWSNGETKVATCLQLYISYDDLATRAAFQYSLCDANLVNIYEGQIIIDGQSYLDWGSSGDSNEEAYALAATQLNITLA
jgi:hypothetical protein